MLNFLSRTGIPCLPIIISAWLERIVLRRLISEGSITRMSTLPILFSISTSFGSDSLYFFFEAEFTTSQNFFILDKDNKFIVIEITIEDIFIKLFELYVYLFNKTFTCKGNKVLFESITSARVACYILFISTLPYPNKSFINFNLSEVYHSPPREMKPT